ncbi:hypothetical protein J1N35_004758 [Gossypium stocksii]|uniref:Uncharacterized protein n=1 Tax=Gossypium stocksii TaxID=47602 RepID=A0A9D3WE86_9ROSI|nr:hypothetical protein J1N35_004758 [Gossypium stocksii]
MDEDLANLNIADDEEEIIKGQSIDEEDDEEYELCLVGKVLMESVVHFSSMRWTLAEGIKGNTVVFQQTPCVTSSIRKSGAPISRHGEDFCPIRLMLESQEVTFAWDLSIRAQTRMGQSEDCKWLREARLVPKLPVGGQFGGNEEKSIGVIQNNNTRQDRMGHQEGMNYGIEKVRFMEIGSNIEEIPIGMIDTKKR